MRLATSLLALLLVPRFASAQQPPQQLNVPPHGFVPDSATAVRIAVAVWTPLYGEPAIMGYKSFVAKLKDGVWTVTASPSFPPPPLIIVDGRVVGGVAPVAMIAQRDARILRVSQDW
jgi:hypothetical protein